VTRPHCCVFIATSLDGFIARRDGGLDWLDLVAADGEDYGYTAFFTTIDALVIGRRTYETALGFDAWPYIGKRVVVLTHVPGQSRHGETFAAEAPGPLLARLHAEGSRRVYVDGGVVIRDFLAAGAIDELTLSVIPILLGAGIPLFGDTGIEHRLHAARARHFPSGLVQLSYRLR